MDIGIIGGGNMGVLHGGLINKNKNLKLAAVFDNSAEKGEAAARLLDTVYTGTMEELFKKCEMVFITVPNTAHAELAVKALEAGKHVFVEKPLATNLADAEKVMKAADKAGRRVFVGHNRRFAPVYKEARDIISGGGFKPSNINIIQNDGDMLEPAWLTDIKMTGGFMYDTTVHFLDMARYLMGEVTELRALGKAVCYPIADDFAVLLTFKNGGHGVITTCGHASWISPFERVQVVGDHKSVITEELDSLRYSPGLGKIVEGRDYSKLSHEEKWGYAAMHEHMFNALKTGTEAQNSMTDGYMTVELIEACHRSAGQNGEPVRIGLP